MAEQTNFQSAPDRLEDLSTQLASALTSAIVSDSLDSLGVRSQVMAPEIMPFAMGSRAVGRARTIQFAPTETDPEDPYDAAMRFIDGLGGGSVAVIATGADARTAYWGELFSAAAKGHGAVGAVCDGPVRDVAKIRALGFDVFAAGSRPVDFRGRMRVVATDEMVRCGGVLVAPGDLVVADDDGVVVVPAAVEAEVLARSVARAMAERSVLAELLDGASLREVWERWHVL
jgi:4-hydroxy-4-methyl-2-oxoglutarate aldolase